MNDLKPCHCQTTPILQHTPETGFYIYCPTCQSYTHGVQWSREEALAVWNERADENGIAALQAELSALKNRAVALYNENTELTAELDALNTPAYMRNLHRLSEDCFKRKEALEAENAKLRDPWVRIDPERPETLPKASCLLLLTCVYPTERAWPVVCMGYWDNFVFANQDGEPLEKFGLRVIAYQPWPEPAPYPGDETP